MGFLAKKIEEQKQSKDAAAAKIKERLEFLQCAAKNKIENFEAEMQVEFQRAKETAESWSIVGRPFEFLAQYRVDVKEGISKEIEDALDGLFQFDKRSLKSALSVLVKNALKEVVITASVGESYMKHFFIVPYNNAIIRTDIRVWRYNFSNQAVIGNIENAFCFITSKAVIDHKRLTADELIYFVTEGLNGASLEQVGEYIGELKKIWSMLEKPGYTTPDKFTSGALPLQAAPTGWERV